MVFTSTFGEEPSAFIVSGKPSRSDGGNLELTGWKDRRQVAHFQQRVSTKGLGAPGAVAAACGMRTWVLGPLFLGAEARPCSLGSYPGDEAGY
jgi:hypothetical protein